MEFYSQLLELQIKTEIKLESYFESVAIVTNNCAHKSIGFVFKKNLLLMQSTIREELFIYIIKSFVLNSESSYNTFYYL